MWLCFIADILPKPKTELEQGTESEADSGLATIQETEETGKIFCHN